MQFSSACNLYLCIMCVSQHCVRVQNVFDSWSATATGETHWHDPNAGFLYSNLYLKRNDDYIVIFLILELKTSFLFLGVLALFGFGCVCVCFSVNDRRYTGTKHLDSTSFRKDISTHEQTSTHTHTHTHTHHRYVVIAAAPHHPPPPTPRRGLPHGSRPPKSLSSDVL